MGAPTGDVQYSPDGQHWWDGHQWQPVHHDGAGSSHIAGPAQFSLGADDTFRLVCADGGTDLTAGREATLTYALKNTGGAPGAPVVSFLVDGEVKEDTRFSVEFRAGESLPEEYCFMPIQPIEAGTHTVTLVVEPGQPGADRLERSIEVKEHA